MPPYRRLGNYPAGAERIIAVSEEEVAEAVRIYYRTIHTTAEGAGAAALAGLMQEHQVMSGKAVGVILTGGNIDMDKFRTVLAGGIPDA